MTSPSRVTTPARIFVPPRSTPIACVTATMSGYRNPPDGRLRGEAVPRLSRRTAEGEGAAAVTRGPRRTAAEPAGRAPTAQAVDVEAVDAAHARRPHRPVRHLGRRGLSL